MKLNESLAAFALRPPAFDVVTAYTSDYAQARGLRDDRRAKPSSGRAGVFHDAGSFQSALRARSRHAESMHVPRAGPLSSACSRRSSGVPAVSAGAFRALPKPHAALPHDERCLSRHQSAAAAYISTKAPSACWTSRAGRPAAHSIRRRKVTRSSRTRRRRNFVSASAAVTDPGGSMINRTCPRGPSKGEARLAISYRCFSPLGPNGDPRT